MSSKVKFTQQFSRGAELFTQICPDLPEINRVCHQTRTQHGFIDPREAQRALPTTLDHNAFWSLLIHLRIPENKTPVGLFIDILSLFPSCACSRGKYLREKVSEEGFRPHAEPLLLLHTVTCGLWPRVSRNSRHVPTRASRDDPSQAAPLAVPHIPGGEEHALGLMKWVCLHGVLPSAEHELTHYLT